MGGVEEKALPAALDQAAPRSLVSTGTRFSLLNQVPSVGRKTGSQTELEKIRL
jgi:hypothetical protein